MRTREIEGIGGLRRTRGIIRDGIFLERESGAIVPSNLIIGARRRLLLECGLIAAVALKNPRIGSCIRSGAVNCCLKRLDEFIR